LLTEGSEAVAERKKPGAIYWEPGTPIVELIPGVSTFERFSMAWETPVGYVELDVLVTEGNTRAGAVRVFEGEDEAGVTGVTIAGVSVEHLLEQAVLQSTRLRARGSLRPREQELKATTRRRTKLREVADAYNRGHLPAVQRLSDDPEGYSERHARRLIAEAKAAGLIKEKS
jgi:hypothetical protein